jgi:hypothetical protein
MVLYKKVLIWIVTRKTSMSDITTLSRIIYQTQQIHGRVEADLVRRIAVRTYININLVHVQRRFLSTQCVCLGSALNRMRLIISQLYTCGRKNSNCSRWKLLAAVALLPVDAIDKTLQRLHPMHT